MHKKIVPIVAIIGVLCVPFVVGAQTFTQPPLYERLNEPLIPPTRPAPATNQKGFFDQSSLYDRLNQTVPISTKSTSGCSECDAIGRKLRNEAFKVVSAPAATLPATATSTSKINKSSIKKKLKTGIDLSKDTQSSIAKQNSQSTSAGSRSSLIGTPAEQRALVLNLQRSDIVRSSTQIRDEIARINNVEFLLGLANSKTASEAVKAEARRAIGSGHFGTSYDGAIQNEKASLDTSLIGEKNLVPEKRPLSTFNASGTTPSTLRNGYSRTDYYSDLYNRPPSTFNQGQIERRQELLQRDLQNGKVRPMGFYDDKANVRDNFSKVSCGVRSIFSFLGLGCK